MSGADDRGRRPGRRPAHDAELGRWPGRGPARDAELGRWPGRGPAHDADDLRRRLERAPLPDADEAERRAWAVVRSAAPAARPSRLRRRAPIAALAAALGVLVAVTPPGAAVGDWVRDRVDPPPKRTVEPARASRLPAEGRLLVRDDRGVAVVAQDGSRTRLGRYDGATWSAHGRFVAAWRGSRLTALTPSGQVRWTIDAPAPVRAARWSLADGYRIAYVTAANQLRIVGGDGTGDRALTTVGAAIPAWRPDDDRVLAFTSPRGRLEIRDVDTGALLDRLRSPVPRGTRTLSWSADGRHLAAAGPRAIRVYDLRDGSTGLLHARARERFTTAAYAPRDRTLARVTRTDGRSFVRAGAGERARLGRELFATRGRIARAAWSPDAGWLMLEMPDQLVAVRVVGPPRVLSYPGGRLEGWAR
jgi:hypothetical protein